jgi:glycosyltransferase involved in cell wall biosynthesis
MLGRHPGWVPNPSEELATRLIARGYECLLVSNKLNRFHRLADILATVWKYRSRVDVVCIQTYSGSGFFIADLASALATWLKLPVIMHLHGGGLPEFIEHSPNWCRRVFKRTQTMIAPSGFLAQAIASIGFDAVMIPNAIQLENYPFRHRTATKPNLLWMRTFHEIYNPLLAVDILHDVKKTHPNAVLTMAGQDRGLMASVKDRAQKLGVTDSLRLVGFLGMQAKQQEFSKHDIFLNTNRVDNMPVSIIEAAAFGLPIVTTSVGGLPYLITDGEDGILIKDNDLAAMVCAIRRVLGDPDLAGKFSTNARQLGERHDWSVVLPQWEEILQTIEKTKNGLI